MEKYEKFSAFGLKKTSYQETGSACALAFLIAKDAKFLPTDNKDSDQTAHVFLCYGSYDSLTNVSKRSVHPVKYKVKYSSEEKFGEEKNKLLEKRSNLTGEITSVLRDIGHLETELDRLTHDIAETGQWHYSGRIV